MLAVSRWKFWGIIVTCLLGIIFASPNMLSPKLLEKMPFWLQKTINLGLELRGGSHLQLEVDLKTVTREYLTTLISDARASLRKEQIGYIGLKVDPKAETPVLKFSLRDSKDAAKARTIIAKVDKDLDVQVNKSEVIATLSREAVIRRNKNIIEQSIEVIRRRIDESGTKEPNIQRQGNDRILVQLPGVDDPAQVKKLIGKTAKMSFKLVDSTAPVLEGEQARGSAPMGSEYLTETLHNGNVVKIAVRKHAMVSGESLIDAQATTDQHGQPAVSLRFNAVGARKFAEMSAQNLQKQFAIVLDDKIISAPVFREVINDGHGQISGSMSFKDASELSLLLRAGALPAPLKVIEERTVGPSLGADSIYHGKLGTAIAFGLVSIFMLASYSMFGGFAVVALIFNLTFLFAGLSLLQATLTLPGIAGIALTIGMAVDANVLIYERIKEELRNGSKPIQAIDSGYRRAMTTIIDSNLTTLIGAFVLFEFGTGPIRGFAVTLALGILISLFTALSLTRLIIIMWLGKRKVSHLPI